MTTKQALRKNKEFFQSKTWKSYLNGEIQAKGKEPKFRSQVSKWTSKAVKKYKEEKDAIALKKVNGTWNRSLDGLSCKDRRMLKKYGSIRWKHHLNSN